MYGFVYGLFVCTLLSCHWHDQTVNGVGVSRQEKGPTSNLNTLPPHDRWVYRHLALFVALAEHLAQEGVEVTTNLTGQQYETILEPRVMHTEKRLKRDTTYQPYTANPYDLGPLNECSTPKLSQCSYSSDVTIPEYMARRLPSLFKSLQSLLNEQFQQLPANADKRCVNDAVIALICGVVANPRCTGNNVVSYRPFSVTDCNSAIAKVSSCSDLYKTALQAGLCTNDILSGLDLPTGTYSLTRCVTPSIDECDSVGTSPEWIAAAYQSDDPTTVLNTLTSDTCKTTYLRVYCTIPTCTSDGNLTGTLTYDQCNSALNCVSAAQRPSVDSSLLCDSYKTITIPSWSSAGLTVSGNILLSSLLLIVASICV
jgi:hypothetical protein